MDDKCINATGLAHIWKAITQVFATKEYVDDELAKVDTSGGSGGSAGGSAVEEIFYVDAVFDFSTFTIVSIEKTYAEIVTMLEAGKYIVMRASYALVAAPVNVGYFPLVANVVEDNFLMFTSMVNVAINGQAVLLHLTAFMFANGSSNTKVQVVSVTDLN